MKFDANDHHNILVVAPFTMRLGVAVFFDSALVYFAVKSFRRPRTIESVKAEASTQLKLLIAEFGPKFIIAKTLNAYQKDSAYQQQVFKEIKYVAKLSGIPLKQIAFEKVSE